MNQVGQEFVESVQKLQELAGQLEVKFNWGMISFTPMKGYRFEKEKADELVELFGSVGCTIHKSERDTFSIERELSIPDVTRFTVKISHTPSEADKEEALREKIKQAQEELESLRKKEESA